jgi:16S rRNA (cytidine1402-2'-O)-methyltransferase
MTKQYEEIIRAPLSELVSKIEEREILGEVTVVLAGRSEIHHEPEDLIAAVLARESLGISRKDAIADIAREMKVPKRELFDVMVAYKKDHES